MSFSVLFDEKKSVFAAERNPLVTPDLSESTTDDNSHRQGRLAIILEKKNKNDRPFETITKRNRDSSGNNILHIFQKFTT